MNKPVIVDENQERRTHTVEMRVKDAGYGKKSNVMDGYAANFNVLSENLGGFREILMQGCFKDCLASSDVRGLFNHDPNLILGRNTSGTLRLSEDERGLHFEIDPPETSYAKDLEVSMKRGDVNQCSFGFRVAENGDSWAKDSDGLWIRTITKVERLYDVSPVTYPAYTQTSCAVRSMLQKEADKDAEEKRTIAEAEEIERIRLADVAKRKLELEEML